MAQASVKRRGHGEDAIYFEAAKNRYVGAVSLGYAADGKRLRRKVSGRTKQEVRDRLKALHADLDAGIRSSAGYTVRRAVEDWLREGLDGRSTRTRRLYEGLLEPVLEIIGARAMWRIKTVSSVIWYKTRYRPARRAVPRLGGRPSAGFAATDHEATLQIPGSPSRA
jgi:hypothetical protein